MTEQEILEACYLYQRAQKTLLGIIGGAAVIHWAPNRLKRSYLQMQGVFKEKNKLEQLFIHNDVYDIVRTFKP